MSEAMHTAGPWALDETGWICDANGSPVCRINPGLGAHELEPHERADARLIAAAPDILDALKYVAERIRGSDEWWMDCPNKGGFDLDLIESAIAKAEGK